MIPISLSPEPAGFDANVRQRGDLYFTESTGAQPNIPRQAGRPFKRLPGVNHPSQIPAKLFPDYWTWALPHLRAAFNDICAYSCFRIHPVTGAASVDHMAPKSKDWSQVYEWNNYRLASSRLNSRKSDYSDVLDPCLIGVDWFQLELYGFQMIPNSNLPIATIQEIDLTISRLDLNDTFHCDQRHDDAWDYWNGQFSLQHLERTSPFVAAELRRQARLNAGDH